VLFFVVLELGEMPEEAKLRPETVLFAEDEDMLRRLVARLLREYGYTVIDAASGTDALRAAAAHEGPIDLLLTDIMMPGLNGPDLATRVRMNRPEVRVLYISGFLNEAELDPGSNFLGKPFTPSDLLDKIRSVLGEAPPA
jgi:two-component system, cell cycle sensor histidine kinase and response regulator CckA